MIELNTLNFDDLVELKFEVEAAIKATSTEQKAAARQACEALANEHGYTLAELIEPSKSKSGNGKKKSHVPGVPKYRNPHNPAQTWTGKGTRPGWFVASLASGMTPEQMLI